MTHPLVEKHGQLCLFCEHFDIWSSEAGWSELTPGIEMGMDCAKSQWPEDYDASPAKYRETILMGSECIFFGLTRDLK